MSTSKRYTKILQQLFEELLDEEKLDAALGGCLELLVSALKSEAGVIWLLDEKTDRLVPMIHIGPVDLSNFSVECGQNLESFVTKSGESVMKSAPDEDPRFKGLLMDDLGLKTQSVICVALNNLQKSYGCLEIINKKDGSAFDGEELQLCERVAALAALTIDEKGLAVEAGEKKDVLISMRGIIKDFPSGAGTVHVLKGVDLDIYKGEFLVILGESGCGKSTLVNIIGGMDSLTDGSLFVEGKDFSHPTDAQLTEYRREYMGFVFQSYNLMPNLTAQENVQYIADIVPKPMSAEDAIAKVGLAERANNYPSALSGGQ